MVYVSPVYDVRGPQSLLAILDHLYEELSKPVVPLGAIDNYVSEHDFQRFSEEPGNP